MYINKSAAARILKINARDIKEVRIYKGKVLVRYRMNKGNCCTFISFKTFQKDFYDYRLYAHLHENVEVINMTDVNDLNSIRAIVKFESSHDSHMVEIVNGEYSCDCHDYQKQLEHGTGFNSKPCCKHLMPVSKSLNFKTFSECVQSTRVKSHSYTLV